MTTDIRFYDTCSLLIAGDRLFNNDSPKFVISSITLQELENIKTSAKKDQDIKRKARELTHLLAYHRDKYDVVVHRITHEQAIQEKNLDITNDTMILSDAIHYNNTERIDETIFVTNDLALYNIANLFFGDDSIEMYQAFDDSYTGYLEVENVADEFLADFYQDLNQNHFDLLVGQYLILRNEDHEVIDIRCWDGETNRMLDYKAFNSKWFGKVQPYNYDVYQKCAFDSLNHNQLTVLRGPAGTGKSYIAMAYLMQELERGHIDNIIVFCNPVAVRDSARLGFYPGNKNEKLLDSQVGNFLVGKFGGMDAVTQLIEQGKLTLIPVADCRGLDIKPNTGIYLTEAQNTSIDLMQLILQRIGQDCVCIIEGDDKAQVDLLSYSGEDNGLAKTSEIFRGEDYYGEVTLTNCYRSRIAARAQLMKK